MVTPAQLRSNAAQMLAAAEVLFVADRYGVAMYLSGYAAEFQLKARIVEAMGLAGFPSDNSEFEHVRTTKGLWLKKHDLNQLLAWSGREGDIKKHQLVDWSLCAGWTPEWRYKEIDKVPSGLAANTLESIKRLLPQL